MAALGDTLILSCAAYDYDFLKNDLIGDCEVDVSWLINANISRRTVNFPLLDPENKSAATGKPLSAGSIIATVDAAVAEL